MKKFIQSKYFTFVLAAFFSVAFIAFFVFNPSHAYFQVHKDFTGVNTAKVDLLFDKFDINDETGTDITKDYGDLKVDRTAVWGTASNPYVIDAPNHISNLSVLQKSGYFNSKAHQCYFVVCTPSGYPVAIDCDELEIAPVGTPALPFTGNVQGAPIAGTYTGTDYTNKYNGYSVSQSAIANLKIVASGATPDIGFFGTLGYVGKYNEGSAATEDTAAVAPSITPLNGKLFNATIDNLLFADITVSDSQKAGVFSTWWGNFADDKAHDANQETHHVGIVAGHSKWATLTKLSVYYSPAGSDTTSTNVAAFQLSGISETDAANQSSNYYSITGILGTLEYTNPTKEYDANNNLTKLDGTNAINDEDLAEEIVTGGGGDEGGILTGYMRAENIFNRKDSDNKPLTLENYAEAYDVKYITESGADIFSSVNVEEGGVFWDRDMFRYYYFSDSIFTFAMSARGYVADDNGTENDLSDDTVSVVDGKIDYLVRIWDITDKKCPVTISLTKSEEDWEQVTVAGDQYLFKLTAASSIADYNNTDGTGGATYVLGYKDEDGRIYIFNLANNNGFVDAVTLETIIDPNTNKEYAVDYLTGATDTAGAGKYLVYKEDGSLMSDVYLGKLYKGSVSEANHVIPKETGFILYPRLPVTGTTVADADGYIYQYQRVRVVDADGNDTDADGNPVTDADGYMYKRIPILDEDGNETGEYYKKPLLDENGDYVYEQIPVYETVEQPVVDENGDPVVDEDGNQVYETVTVQKLDEDGNPVYKDGDQIYETFPVKDENGDYVVDENGSQVYEPVYLYEYLYSDTPLYVNGQLAYCNYSHTEDGRIEIDKYRNIIYISPKCNNSGIITYNGDNITYDRYTQNDAYGNLLYKIEPVHLEVGSFHVVSTNANAYTNAFKYHAGDDSVAISSAVTGNRFGITSVPVQTDTFGRYPIYEFFEASIYNSGTAKPVSSINVLHIEPAYWYNWQFARNTSANIPNAFSVSGSINFVVDNFIWEEVSYYAQQLVFNTSSNKFVPKLFFNQNQTPTININSAQEDTNLLLFKVEKVTKEGSSESVKIPAKNFETENAISDSFDASTHVFFSNAGGKTVNAEGEIVTDSRFKEDSYTLVPIKQLKWNNGNGAYLEQLNHAVKLAQATASSYQLAFKNLIGDNLVGNILDFLIGQNTGGVVTAPIGKSETYYTIPAGMIAFNIQQASPEDPSYINIIVAVNPEQQPSSSIGVYYRDPNAWNGNFDLNSGALQSFPLPVSTPGISGDSFDSYHTKVSSYYKTTDGGKTYTQVMQTKTVGEGENAKEEFDDYYYTYLGGDIVLVGYTFTMTEPGIYLLGSNTGPMTVCYFSVDGAAGAGGDGTGGSPLGDVDFVYDNGTDTIITVDKKFGGSHVLASEIPEEYYYPSYYYIRLLPDASKSTKINSEELKVRRYIDSVEKHNRRRYINVSKTNPNTKYVGILDMYEDNDKNEPTS